MLAKLIRTENTKKRAEFFHVCRGSERESVKNEKIKNFHSNKFGNGELFIPFEAKKEFLLIDIFHVLPPPHTAMPL